MSVHVYWDNWCWLPPHRDNYFAAWAAWIGPLLFLWGDPTSVYPKESE